MKLAPVLDTPDSLTRAALVQKCLEALAVTDAPIRHLKTRGRCCGNQRAQESSVEAPELVKG